MGNLTDPWLFDQETSMRSEGWEPEMTIFGKQKAIRREQNRPQNRGFFVYKSAGYDARVRSTVRYFGSPALKMPDFFYQQSRFRTPALFRTLAPVTVIAVAALWALPVLASRTGPGHGIPIAFRRGCRIRRFLMGGPPQASGGPFKRFSGSHGIPIEFHGGCRIRRFPMGGPPPGVRWAI